jgi:tetratricopeptide (TPR) repeat protein
MKKIKYFIDNEVSKTILRKVSAFLFIVLGLIPITKAQFFDELSNPLVSVNIKHPPELGLKISKIAFNTASGNCADQIIDAIISDFVNNNIEVVDRANLQTILAEHDFNFSGYVDQSTAVKIGKIIGPSALITVKVLRCETKVQDDLYNIENKHDYNNNTNYQVKAFIARTSFFLKVSIQTTDLSTGRIFTARVLDYTPVRENKSYNGKPEPPTEFDVQEIAYSSLVEDVHRMFIPWTSTSDLYFFDDKDGNLKAAYIALQSGIIDETLSISIKNLENCKNTSGIKDKTLAHAYYNLGMSYFIINEYDKAIVNFQQAQSLRPGTIVSEAIERCRNAKASALEMQKVDENAIIEADKALAQKAQAEKAEADNTLTNADIIDLTNKKLPKNLILQKIKTSKCKFDTSSEALILLSGAGVDEEVIMLMMEKK